MTATRVYPVSEVTGYLRDLLGADPVVSDVWVSGEVSNLARPGSGHAYFSLRDDGATLRCAMFKYSGTGADLLDNGAAIIAHGKVSIYPARGELQLVVDLVQPEGVGELQLRFEELKARLDREGLFDQARKRPIRRFPKKVAVVTSPTGAVWHDIQNVISRRYPLVELLIAPTPVQGDAAAAGIVEALGAVSDRDDIDVVILARGGGSAEDLWPFNEEAVARAVFSCAVPVISAVGHETDVSISDWVADVRAPTPSAAAEMVVPDMAEIMATVAAMVRAADSAVSGDVQAARLGLQGLDARMARAVPDMDSMRMRVDELLRASAAHLRAAVSSSTVHVESLKARLETLSPVGTLSRGYAIVQTGPGGTVVSDASDLAPGDTASVTLARGTFDAKVVTVAEPKP
jgi:exodeoxyribonuclease VII large subunit